MAIEFEPVRRVRTHEAVVSRIREEIEAGRIKAGDRLPGERQLAEMMAVSRASVREAMRVLEALEIVTIRPGTGPSSGSVIVGAPGGTLASLLQLHVALSHFSLGEVVGTRLAIETYAAAEAARVRDQEQLAVLEGLVEAMDVPDLDAATFNEMDTRFHAAIAEASGNQLIAYVMQAIRDAIRRQMTDSFAMLDDPAVEMRRLRREHRRIYEAIAAGDADAATRRVRAHIKRFYDGIRTQLEAVGGEN